MATTRAAAEASALSTKDTAERWEAFEERAPGEVVDDVLESPADPGRTREVLTSWLAFELDFSHLWYGRDELETLPLWDVLDADAFESVGRVGERALAAIAGSVEGRLHPSLDPRAALAAIVLWRHARSAETRRRARDLLRERPLPDDGDWLYRLACRLVDVGAARGDDRSPGLYQVAALQLGAGFWRVAARLPAMYLFRRVQSVGETPSRARLVEACDRAAEVDWQREGDWLELMAEAAHRGRLRAPWLEKPVAASLRRARRHGTKREAMRAYHRRRPYEVDRSRLDALYGYLLERTVEQGGTNRAWARRRLLEEIRAALPANPVRALRLAELVLVHEYPTRFGGFHDRLGRALARAVEAPRLPIVAGLLAGLYVACYEVQPHALKFVDAVRHRIDWAGHPVASRRRLDRYLQVSDYDRGFEDLTVSIAGTEVALGDKDAAVGVEYFLERRIERSSLIRFLRRMLAPVDWLGTSLRRRDPLEDASECAIGRLERWFRRRDEREAVVDAYRPRGFPIDTFDDVSRVDADEIDAYADRMETQRLLIGESAGFAAGAFAPAFPAEVSLADLPVKLILAVEIASRFPAVYGFDLRERPDMPREILSVALEADRPSASGDVATTLAELAIQTSLFVRAVGTGDAGPLAGRGVRGLVEQFAETAYGRVVGASLEWAVRGAFEPVEPPPMFQRAAGALLGGLIGGTLVYDVSRSARALLADRFLARKYDDWEPRL